VTQQEKKAAWDELKAAGIEFDRHYRDYTQDELDRAVAHVRMVQEQAFQDLPEIPDPPAPGSIPYAGPTDEYMVNTSKSLDDPTALNIPVKGPAEHAGMRPSSLDNDVPIRTDENGLIWYVDEVRKPSFAKPRGRRLVTYNDPGVKTVEVRDATGSMVESYEMPGDEGSRKMEARITLPSYDVGIYKDPAYPFKIHIYNENRGFDFFEVNDYYGGPELVPEPIKRIYVASTLCYDMRTVIREIEAEFSRLKKDGVIA